MDGFDSWAAAALGSSVTNPRTADTSIKGSFSSGNRLGEVAVAAHSRTSAAWHLDLNALSRAPRDVRRVRRTPGAVGVAIMFGKAEGPLVASSLRNPPLRATGRLESG
jgi:hypothetical protein